MSGHRVAAVAYDRLCTFEFGCVVEVFGLPRPEFDFPWYDFAPARGTLYANQEFIRRMLSPAAALRLVD